jgi:hypothetical protein
MRLHDAGIGYFSAAKALCGAKANQAAKEVDR